MKDVMDRMPNRSDPRLPFIALLACYLVIGITLLGFNRSPVQILLTISFACVIDMLLHYVFKNKRILIPVSAAITGCSLSILVNYSHGLLFPLIPVFFAITSKYLITCNDRHIFNPSLFGIVASLWVSEGMISAAPAYQWGGSIALVVFVVATALTMFVFKIKRSYLIASFLIFYFIALAIRAWMTRWHMPPETWFMGALTSPAFFLFTFFMITDPATSPHSRGGQILMSAMIVIFDLALNWFQITPSLFYAAFIYYTGRFAYLHLRSSHSKIKKSAQYLKFILIRWGSISLLFVVSIITYRTVAIPMQTSHADFYLQKINDSDSNIHSQQGDLLEQIDPKLRHISKWIFSIGDAVAISDVNNDGLPDIFLTNPLKDAMDRAALYINKGDFNFQRIDMPALKDLVHNPQTFGVSSGAIWVDYDNDGDNDLFLLVSFGRTVLLKNMLKENDDLDFVDVTSVASISDYTVSVTANVLDINRDGYLDLIIGNVINPYLDGYKKQTKLNVFKLPEEEYPGDRRMLNFMHRTWYNANNGGENYIYLNKNKKFIQLSSKDIGLYETRWTLDIGTGDFNNDGNTDLYLANDFGPDALYISNGDVHFYKLTGSFLGGLSRDTYKGMNASIGDIDNNGYLDIYISNVHEKLQAEGSMLWMNNGLSDDKGAEAFTDEAVARNVLNERRFGWGAAMGDINRDGLLDIIQVNGMVDDSYDKKYETCPDFWYWNANIALAGPGTHGYADRWADLRGRCIFPHERNRVYLNQGNHFIDVADQVGLAEKGNSRGIALADFDNDGDLDMLITHQFAPVSLYKNNAGTVSWIGIKLIGNGTTCNKNAIGTRVVLKAREDKMQIREVQASNGFSSQSDIRLLFGLGDDYDMQHVDIFWCGSKQVESIMLNPGKYHEIIQR